ncbi:MAG: 2-C-methyl-D-erythritol 2,4-cyclodiphosphate synthase [Candidatus Latescibacteria bacterium]|jgi:2-C-methyl-D-erythritol 2,4-cyclodiphosphate synthase|nr:2-C-methyl-D-erythritol 2,4-cyclodiphosphate synthase [Candidatus Latescibacterota bacterium]
MLRIGHGYDAHRLVERRKLILGGVEIPHSTGLIGHSDADVLSHAVGLALLGAMRLGDLGDNFPSSDPAYKDISSLEILRRIAGMIRDGNGEIQSIDSTIVAQKPRLTPYKDQMITNMAQALDISKSFISVKATTTEKMGFVGRQEGIEAYGVCIIEVIS